MSPASGPISYLTASEKLAIRSLMNEYSRTQDIQNSERIIDILLSAVDSIIFRNRHEVAKLNDLTLQQRLKDSEARCAELAKKLVQWETAHAAFGPIPQPPTDRRFPPPQRSIAGIGEAYGQYVAKAQNKLAQTAPLDQYCVRLFYSDHSFGSSIVRACDAWQAEKLGISVLAQYIPANVKIVSTHTHKM